MTEPRWVIGDTSGLSLPADGEALRAGGEALLTRLFHASGALPTDNRVAAITQCDNFAMGGTGSKLLLAVAYQKPAPGLGGELFVKFSRNFRDPIRDRVRHMLKPEIEFAALSRLRGFPVVVPTCYFADFHQATGTGLLITERIPYGRNGLEPHYTKCMDHLVPEPLAHYRAIMVALARLGGSHQAGRLPAAFYRAFPFHRDQALAADPLRYRDDKLRNRLSRLAEFAARYPQLLPANVRAPAFLARFADEVARFVAAEGEIRQWLYSRPELIALCHWNANIDNAWFWRDAGGGLACGLMDWGEVGQMSVAKSIYGAFSGADTALWDDHLDDILQTFIDEFAASGGSSLDLADLKRQVLLFTALMGVAYLLDAPALIERHVPDLAAITSPLDEAFLQIEDARVQLHMLTMFLNQWQTRDIGGLVAGLRRP